MKVKIIDVAIFGGVILSILIMMKLTLRDQEIEAFNNKESTDDKVVEKVKRPFVNIYDQKGRMLNEAISSMETHNLNH